MSEYVQEGTDEDTIWCKACNRRRARDAFSSSQLKKKGRGSRTCKACLDSEWDAAGGPKTPRDEPGVKQEAPASPASLAVERPPGVFSFSDGALGSGQPLPPSTVAPPPMTEVAETLWSRYPLPTLRRRSAGLEALISRANEVADDMDAAMVIREAAEKAVVVAWGELNARAALEAAEEAAEVAGQEMSQHGTRSGAAPKPAPPSSERRRRRHKGITSKAGVTRREVPVTPPRGEQVREAHGARGPPDARGRSRSLRRESLRLVESAIARAADTVGHPCDAGDPVVETATARGRRPGKGKLPSRRSRSAESDPDSKGARTAAGLRGAGDDQAAIPTTRAPRRSARGRRDDRQADSVYSYESISPATGGQR